MARTLMVVAGTGIAISVLSLSLATVVSPGAGRWLLWPGTGEPGWWGPLARWEERAPFAESGAIVSREFAWTGGDRVEVNIPGVVHFTPAPEWKVTATGRETGMERLRIDAGRIDFDGTYGPSGSSSIDVRIEGPALTRFVLNGSGDVVLDSVDQQELEVEIRGSGSIRGRGRVGRLTLTIIGSGDAELGDVSTGDAEVRIVGSGDAEVAPAGRANVDIVGSGDVQLRTQPASLSTRTVGSGNITP